MPVYASPQALADVMAELCPHQAKTPREIAARIPLTGRNTIYNALYMLVNDGRAVFEGEMCKRRYRLVGDAR